MKSLKKIVIGLFVILTSQGLVWGQKHLAKDAPERAQLSAMGYEFIQEQPGDQMTVATSPLGMVVGISKTEERTSITRFYVRQSNLNLDQELRLLRKVNELNRKLYFQAAIMPENLVFTAYVGVTHNAREFARTIGWLEKIETIISEDKELLSLLNESEPKNTGSPSIREKADEIIRRRQ